MLILYLSLLVCTFFFSVIAIYGHVNMKTKMVLMLSLIDCILISIVLIIMSNSNYSDIQNYEYHYGFSRNNMMEARFEVGFNTYMYICKYVMHLNFYTFKILTFFICILFIYKAFRKYTYNFSLFLLFFLGYEIFFDGIQIRNFIAISIVIYGIPYLLNNNIKGTIKYLVCVMVAFLFHSSAIAFVILGLVNMDFKKTFENKYVKQILTVCIFLISVGLILAVKNGKLIQLLSTFSYQYISNDVGNRIISHSGGKSHSGPIFLSIIYFAYVLFVHFINSSMKNCASVNYKVKYSFCKVRIEKYTIQNTLFDKMEQINYIGMLFIPLSFLSTTYYRLLRNICLIDIIFYAIAVNNLKNKNVRILLFTFMFLLIILWVYYDLIVPDRFIEHIIGYLGGVK